MAYFFVVGGLFAFFSALANVEWFMTHPRAELFVKLFGRTGARIVYALIGLALVVIGGAMILFPGETGAE